MKKLSRRLTKETEAVTVAKIQCNGFLLELFRLIDSTHFSKKEKKEIMPPFIKKWEILRQMDEESYDGISGFLKRKKDRKFLMKLNEECRNFYKKNFGAKESFKKRYTGSFLFFIKLDFDLDIPNKEKKLLDTLYKKYNM